MKTVAIVGAGPSGLVAAKTLLRNKRCKFDVSVFEKKHIIGGLWAVDRHDSEPSQLINADMPTNASRYTVSFSDLAWSSMDLSDEQRRRAQPRGADGQPFVPMFPKAWQVRKYLEEYASRYIPEGVIRVSSAVTRTERIRNEAGKLVWRVDWKDELSSQSNSGVFDYLIVSSGFFSEPSFPASAKLVFESIPRSIKIVHSSKLRRIDDVIPDDASAKGTILVVGGAMSGAEAAAALAMGLSDAQHKPGGKAARELEVLHVAPRPFYALPPIVPYDKHDSEAPRFFTLDMAFYDLSRRPPGPVNPGEGRQPPQVSNGVHKFLRSLIGGDQSELGSETVVATDTYRPAFAAIQESYSEFVRSGAIRTITGHLDRIDGADSVDESQGNQIRVSISDKDKSIQVDDVVGIVYATGFRPNLGLEILSDEVKDLLGYDAECRRLPLLLGDQSITSDKIDNLAFIGLYEGPFWGAMEKQAEYLADKWREQNLAGGASDVVNGDETKGSTREEFVRDLRMAMKSKAQDVPQYWMGDCVGIIEKLSRQAKISRNEMGLEPRTGPVLAARYASDTADASEAEKLVKDLIQSRKDGLEKARFVSRATFRAMHGKWRIARQLDSLIAAYPSGQLTGEASFHPRKPTDDAYDGEYLYIESGTLQTQNGLTLQASRRYVYRYQELMDRITVWFVKDDGKTVDYLYNELLFDPAAHNVWIAKSDHLCIADMYRSEYAFRFKGINVTSFTIKHAVKGPHKDYISDTSFSR